MISRKASSCTCINAKRPRARSRPDTSAQKTKRCERPPKRSQTFTECQRSQRLALVERQRGGCQNYGPKNGTLNMRCCIILGTQKGTIILTTTQRLAMNLSYLHSSGLPIYSCSTSPELCPSRMSA